MKIITEISTRSMFLLQLVNQQRTDPKMRVDCPHCMHKAVITSSNALSPTVKDLYCQCTNTRHCGASFVYKLGYSHDLNPPVTNVRELAAEVLRNLSPADRNALIQSELFTA
ncbi:ogr/Delta-like zinc finger family protein [Methylophaga sp.]|uniref:ogr/Delta-like zinc finger family protein n=1 Tax=Methylophaga sp. TaxID=2024840 RepID=UPI0025D3AFB1|nr:ogr/Delta-like zinc finger family protein [Methylophaga sp.]